MTAEAGDQRRGSLSRLNVLIAGTAAIVGLIYGYDLGSIAGALLFLVPDFGLSTFETSILTSAVVLGQLCGRLLRRAHLQHHRTQADDGVRGPGVRGVRRPAGARAQTNGP